MEAEEEQEQVVVVPEKKVKAKKEKVPVVEDEVVVPAAEPVDESFDDALLPHWSSLPVHSLLKRSIYNLGFFKPSPIQATTLPFGLAGRDIVGVAETGSGKTLAYGLPILNHCFSLPPPAPFVKPAKGPAPRQKKRAMQALILAPTRELALQVCQHLQKAVDAALVIPSLDGEEVVPAVVDGGDATKPKGPAGPPRVSVGAIVGGMSAQKQKRVLERGVDILVATPGRLWDLIGENEDIAHSIRNIQFLVIDEADRMIETGHFVELESIVALTHRSTQTTSGSQSDAKPKPGSTAEEDLKFVTVSEKEKARESMQTFVYSATLSKELQRNLKKFSGKPREGKKKKGTTLDDLFEKLDFRDADPEIIDLSSEDGMVSTLQESKIECMSNEKDLYLYYFLLRYPGRSLIFFGSIDGIRRAVPLLELLKFPIFPLHSQLQQKQRLKNLDRFKASPNGILLATDIAARGLDIPSVDHVIHYQLPRSADVYVHRSGRTARAMNVGFSLQLCSPEEKRVQKALMKSLGRDDELPELPIEHGMLDKLKQRILVARKIDAANHKVKKDNHEKSWIKEAAEALEIDIDSDNMPTDDDDDEDRRGHRGNAKSNSVKVANLKNELRALMAQPLVARGISSRYITGGSRKIVDALIQGTQHGAMMGMSTDSAASDAAKGKSKKRKAQAPPPEA
ncbi:P-loop containing nucleoside triphosphate hydrolase protein [Mrakia frigida]|uniref:ATP-dependent RNA helicase n=1 Tax=Mrakia frigida TaxID=29902 RepID=UPI003FCBF6D8